VPLSHLDKIRFVNRETLQCGDASATLAVYKCPWGFFVIWICSCEMVNHQVLAVEAADAAARLASASYREHCAAAHSDSLPLQTIL
jgi:hypothetical protein